MAATPRQLAAYTAAFGAYVAAIHVIPGPWRNWRRGRWVDSWTITHLLWGYIGSRMSQNFGQQMALASANEVFEALIRRYRPDWLWAEPESSTNITMDLVANALGWSAARLTHG